MKHYITFTISTFILLFSYIGSAQTMKLNNDKISYNNKLYALGDLDSVFALNPHAHLEYLDYKYERKNATHSIKMAGVLSAATIAGGVITHAIAINKRPTPKDRKANTKISMGITSLLGIFALHKAITFKDKFIKSKRHLNKAIYYINSDNSLSNSSKEVNHIIDFGMTTNGLGLMCTF